MNFCAIDWNELIKILTPFVIAFCVYQIWHNQKGKEVIANAAKECILDIFSLMTSNVLIQLSTTRNDKDFEEVLLDFKKVNVKNIKELSFIMSSIDNEELKKAQEKHTENCGKVMKFIRAYNTFTDKNQPIEAYLSSKDFSDFQQSSKDLIDCLKPYAIYSTKFKFRKIT